jgi:hypothetical protein
MSGPARVAHVAVSFSYSQWLHLQTHPVCTAGGAAGSDLQVIWACACLPNFLLATVFKPILFALLAEQPGVIFR